MRSSSIKIKKDTALPALFRKKILDWYDRHRRVLPWRALPEEMAEPYHVWLSEIMLQQTTVKAVIPYFLKFIDLWPDVHALADAENDAVMKEWAGLGYYARARNLHKCAKVISYDYDGVFPSDQMSLRKLPGIGDYTSAAITSIAFDRPATVVDGNVERVMARYHAYDVALPDGKAGLKELAHLYADGFDQRPGDYAQALMDLGATICTPKKPACSLCPVNDDCVAYNLGRMEDYPVKGVKKAKNKRYGAVYWVTNEQGQVLVHKRPEKGLLGGMYGLPTSEWTPDVADFREHLDFLEEYNPEQLNLSIRHVFTHFELSLELYSCVVGSGLNLPEESEHVWLHIDSLDELISFPTVFNKAYKLFIS